MDNCCYVDKNYKIEYNTERLEISFKSIEYQPPDCPPDNEYFIEVYLNETDDIEIYTSKCIFKNENIHVKKDTLEKTLLELCETVLRGD